MHLLVPAGGTFRETRRIELGARALTIGRSEKCDIRLDVPGVDPEHAKISEVALVAMGADCAVGDVPLDPGGRRLVTPGDEIQIGSVVVALEGDDPNAYAGGPNLQAQQGCRVRVVEGQNFGDELLLLEEGREYVIGRHAHCDLVLEDREVSREHIKLVRRGFTVMLQDLSSTRGSWLGRAAVYSQSTIEWSRPRMLRVGATVLSLELPDGMRKATAPAVLAGAGMTPAVRRAPSATPVMQAPIPHPSSAPPPGPAVPVAFESAPVQAPAFAVTAAPIATPREAATGPRTAWKAKPTTISRGSGILLLALAGLAILGALFVVFSLLE